MFLWVRLVLSTFEESYTEKDLGEAIETLPEDLETLYGKLLPHIMLSINFVQDTRGSFVAFAEKEIHQPSVKHCVSSNGCV